MRHLPRFFVALVVSSLGMTAMVQAATADSDSKTAPTHKQLRTIKPQHGQRNVTLWMISLAGNGDLWCSVSTGPRYQVPRADRNSLPVDQDSFQGIQVYDADGELQAEYPLSFTASAINFAPDGTLFVAGQGQMARLSASGEVLAESATPNIGDMEEYTKKVVERAAVQRKKHVELYRKQAETYAQQIKILEEKEEADLPAQVVAQLETLKRQQKQFEQILKQLETQVVDPASAVLRSLSVPGIAATAEHVFLVVSSSSGRGYEVWRTNHEFAEGEVVRDGLLGCCGNMDVQARGDGFVACENSRFKVASYDRDGEPLASFGRRDRTAPDGFGSCCNPMNCLSLENGDYVVAESGIGNIKRFDREGNFLGIVGKAKISGSCKHVSLGFDRQRDRYYMMNQDKNHVCVLVPLSEAPAVTDDERRAIEAKTGLGKKLVGRWQVEDYAAKKRPKSDRPANVFVASTTDDSDLEAEFLEDGAAKITGGKFRPFQNAAQPWSWECVEQTGDVLTMSLLYDGVEFQTLRAQFADDDHLTFHGCMYFPKKKTFVRATGKPAE